MKKRMLSFALLALLLVAGFAVHQVATAPRAHAANCFASGCDGFDPALSGCWGDATVRATSAVTSIAYVQLLHSVACDASWTWWVGGDPRVTNASVSIEDSDGTYFAYNLGKGSRVPIEMVTPMVGPGAAQACGTATIAGVLHNNCTAYTF